MGKHSAKVNEQRQGRFIAQGMALRMAPFDNITLWARGMEFKQTVVKPPEPKEPHVTANSTALLSMAKFVKSLQGARPMHPGTAALIVDIEWAPTREAAAMLVDAIDWEPSHRTLDAIRAALLKKRSAFDSLGPA